MLKKLLTWTGRVLAALLAIVTGLLLYVQLDGLPHFHRVMPERQVTVTPERVARGRKLSSLLCVHCHLDASSGRLTGKVMTDLPPEFGTVVSKNITHSRSKGIGAWSDGQLAYLLRTGIRPDGTYVPPYMIKLPHVSDEDLDSIIAFLRSDDPMLVSADVDPPGVTRPSLLVKVLAHTVMRPLPFPERPLRAPAASDAVAYGRYLVYSLDCYSCHSADFKSVSSMDPPVSEGYLGGGNKLLDSQGVAIYSANLTPDAKTGIGRWNEAEFVRTLRYGLRPDGSTLHYPMMPMPELDERDAGAIYAYLRTVPPLMHAVPRRAADASQASEGDPGKRAYAKYGCASCHGEAGLGLADLRRANRDYPTDPELLRWILDAPSLKPGTRMPAWRGIVSEQDYPALLLHVRRLSALADANPETANR